MKGHWPSGRPRGWSANHLKLNSPAHNLPRTSAASSDQGLELNRIILPSSCLSTGERGALLTSEKTVEANESGSGIITRAGDFNLGRVDKRDFQPAQVLIQGCSLRSSHGPWGLVGC